MMISLGRQLNLALLYFLVITALFVLSGLNPSCVNPVNSFVCALNYCCALNYWFISSCPKTIAETRAGCLQVLSLVDYQVTSDIKVRKVACSCVDYWFLCSVWSLEVAGSAVQSGSCWFLCSCLKAWLLFYLYLYWPLREMASSTAMIVWVQIEGKSKKMVTISSNADFYVLAGIATNGMSDPYIPDNVQVECDVLMNPSHCITSKVHEEWGTPDKPFILRLRNKSPQEARRSYLHKYAELSKIPTVPAVLSCCPSKSSYEATNIITRSLGMLRDEDVLKKVYTFPRPLHWSDSMECHGESDVAHLVRTLLSYVLTALELNSELVIASEVSVFETRPNLLLLRKVLVAGHSIPIGVVEVKKPCTDLNNKMQGQLYDYLQMLKSSFNLNFAIGILTNFNQWQVLWLPGNNGDVIARQAVQIKHTSSSPPAASQPSHHHDIPKLDIAGGQNAADCDMAEVEDLLKCIRVCSGTDIVESEALRCWQNTLNDLEPECNEDNSEARTVLIDTLASEVKCLRAKARARYKSDPEKKKASVRDSYNADIESKQSAKRQQYQEDLKENRAAKRQRYQEDVEENRAAKRQKYENNSAAIKASERNRYWNDPAVRLAKHAAERKWYRRGHRTTTTTQSYSLYEPKSHALMEYNGGLEKAILRDRDNTVLPSYRPPPAVAAALPPPPAAAAALPLPPPAEAAAELPPPPPAAAGSFSINWAHFFYTILTNVNFQFSL
ncbi:hypothetical protein EMCRGX_G021288 [Ephydatia muelleri]